MSYYHSDSMQATKLTIRFNFSAIWARLGSHKFALELRSVLHCDKILLLTFKEIFIRIS